VARRTRDIHVVVVGSANFDMVMRADRLPKEGESLLARNLKFFPGGKGANQAVGTARLGAATTFIGSVGQDVIGDYLVHELRTNGIETTYVKRDASRATGSAFILLFPSGNNTIIVEPSANHSLTPADIERALPVIETADALCTQMEIPPETIEASLRLARRAGKLTVLDAGPPRPCPPEVLKLADIVSPNETELESLSGEQISGRVSALEAARKLISFGVKTVVLKLGSDGAMLVTSRSHQHFPAFKVKAVDPTAAGDAFTAGLAVRLAAGEKMDAAIRYANMAGALAVTKLGAQPSLPTAEEVEAFAASQQR
jgi:ribokinase